MNGGNPSMILGQWCLNSLSLLLTESEPSGSRVGPLRMLAVFQEESARLLSRVPKMRRRWFFMQSSLEPSEVNLLWLADQNISVIGAAAQGWLLGGFVAPQVGARAIIKRHLEQLRGPFSKYQWLDDSIGTWWACLNSPPWAHWHPTIGGLRRLAGSFAPPLKASRTDCRNKRRVPY